MTCRGCGRDVTLIDGHNCGQCASEIAEAVSDALEDVDALSDPSIRDVYRADDGYIHVRVKP